MYKPASGASERLLEFGTTCTVALLRAGGLLLGNVGDSGAVLGRCGRCRLYCVTCPVHCLRHIGSGDLVSALWAGVRWHGAGIRFPMTLPACCMLQRLLYSITATPMIKPCLMTSSVFLQ